MTKQANELSYVKCKGPFDIRGIQLYKIFSEVSMDKEVTEQGWYFHNLTVTTRFSMN